MADRGSQAPRNGRAASAPAEDRADPSPALDLAQRVRHLRAAAGLTLKALSERSGISISTLSKIENGQLSPTYEKILGLARGFGVDITALFADRSSAAVTGRRSLTRRGQGIAHATPNYDYELLCSDLTRKRMIPLRAQVKAREIRSFGALLAHEGEEIIYVLSGRIVLHTEFYEPTVLGPGDCAYLDSRMGHGCVAQGLEDATVFWVCTSDGVERLMRGQGEAAAPPGG